MAKRNKLIFSWSLVVLWAAMIWLLSGIPHLQSNLPQDLLLRKMAHALEFAVLTGLFYRAVVVSQLNFIKRWESALASAVLVSLAYAILDEVHQTYVAGRFGAFSDVLIDLAGILLTAVVIIWWHSRLGYLASFEVNKVADYQRKTDNNN